MKIDAVARARPANGARLVSVKSGPAHDVVDRETELMVLGWRKLLGLEKAPRENTLRGKVFAWTFFTEFYPIHDTRRTNPPGSIM